MENKAALCAVGVSGDRGKSRAGGDLELRESKAKCCIPDIHQGVTQNLHHRYIRGGCFSERGSQESRCSSASNENQSRRTDGIL